MKSAYLTFGLTIVHLQSVFFLPISDQTTFCIVFVVGRDDSLMRHAPIVRRVNN